MKLAVAALLLSAIVGTAMSQQMASVYSSRFNGKKTASGEIYNPREYTAASRSLPFNTCLLISRRGHKNTYVRINDRGPWIHGRTLDLSQAAAKSLGIRGVSLVSYRIVGRNLCQKQR